MAIRYAKCFNIVIDGDEFPAGSPDRTNHETGILRQLDRLITTWAGWAVITETYYLGRQGRKMTILPYHPTPATGVCNATARATDLAAATLRGTTALGPQGQLPAPGQPRVVGTGTGSDTILNYNPQTFSVGAACATGPGATADEILLHEMVHGVRQMAGRSVRESVTGNPGMDNYEEFVAILVSNIYRSEQGGTQLRADHAGFAALTGPTTNPQTFYNSHGRFVGYISTEQPRLVQNLRQVRPVAFNPLLFHGGPPTP
jgi:hypothetical protein